MGQLGDGFAYLAAQMLTLIKSGNNMSYFNKDTWTQKGFGTTASVLIRDPALHFDTCARSAAALAVS